MPDCQLSGLMLYYEPGPEIGKLPESFNIQQYTQYYRCVRSIAEGILSRDAAPHFTCYSHTMDMDSSAPPQDVAQQTRVLLNTD